MMIVSGDGGSPESVNSYGRKAVNSFYVNADVTKIGHSRIKKDSSCLNWRFVLSSNHLLILLNLLENYLNIWSLYTQKIIFPVILLKET